MRVYEFKKFGKATVTIDNNFIRIKRKGILNYMAHGRSGETNIDIHSLAEVHMKNASILLEGFIQFVYKDIEEKKNNHWAAVDDKHSIMFHKKEQDMANEIKEYVEDFIANKSSEIISEPKLDVANSKESDIHLKKRKIFTYALSVFLPICTVYIINTMNPSFISDGITTIYQNVVRGRGALLEAREKVQYHHIDIYYLPEDKFLLPLTKESLSYAGGIVEELFDYRLERTGELVIFHDMDEMVSFTGAEFGGFLHGRMIGILPGNREFIKQGCENCVLSYKGLVAHEYYHHIKRAKLRKIGLRDRDIPLWFEEGIAEFVRFTAKTGTTDVNLTPWQLNREVIPLQQLTTNSQFNQYARDENYNVYFQSHIAVRYLIDRFGLEIVNEIILDTKAEGSFEAGFQHATGWSIDEFEGEIRGLYHWNHEEMNWLGDGRANSKQKVIELQKLLWNVGKNPGTVNGVWRADTKNAVIEWQAQVGLPANGIVNAETWESLLNKEQDTGSGME